MENPHEEFRRPVWGTIGLHILCWFLLILIVMLSSCGTRKVENQSNSQSQTSKEERKTNTEVTKESSSEEKNESQETNQKSDEKQESRVRELFDENGKLKERITELINSKSSDNTNKINKTNITKRNRVDSVFNITHYKFIEIKEKSKLKNTDADKTVVKNIGGPWVMIVIVIIIVAALFLFFYLRNKKNNIINSPKI